MTTSDTGPPYILHIISTVELYCTGEWSNVPWLCWIEGGTMVSSNIMSEGMYGKLSEKACTHTTKQKGITDEGKKMCDYFSN